MGDLPRIVWTYWEGGERHASPLVRACIARMRSVHAGRGWEVRCVDRTSVRRWTDGGRAIPAGFAAWSVTQRADWLRLALLWIHGGVWLDASIVLFCPAGDLFGCGDAAELRGFAFPSAEGFGGPHPLLENWALAAAPRSPLVGGWLAEWESALEMGPSVYCDRWIATTGDDGRPVVQPELVRDGRLPYLAAFVAWCVASRVRHPQARVHMRPSVDPISGRGPYGLQAACGWDPVRVADALCWWPRRRLQAVCPHMVKLRRAERQHLWAAAEQTGRPLAVWWRTAAWGDDSCLGEALGLRGAPFRPHALAVTLLFGVLCLWVVGQVGPGPRLTHTA